MNGFETMDLIDEKFINEALGKKYRKKPAFVYWGIGFAKVAVAAAVFVFAFAGVVNCFPVTAYAISHMGFLGDLAKAVTLDKSMRACLEKEYAQYVGEKKTTKDGNVSEVYCMVVDASRISIFFQTDIPKYGHIGYATDEQAEDRKVFEIESGEELEDYEYTSVIVNTDVENLYEYRLDFMDKKIPEKLEFCLNYYAVDENGGEQAVSHSNYTLYPDTKYTKVVKTYQVNESFYVEGQKVTIESLEIYPTQAKLFLHSEQENTARLNDISVTLYDDKGRKYEQNKNGTIGTYEENGNLAAKWYESSYFADTDSITAVIDGVEMIPEDKRYGMISLKNQSIENMPEGVSIKKMKLKKDGELKIELNVPAMYSKWTSIMQWNYIGKEEPEGDNDVNFAISSRGITSEGTKVGSIISEHETNGVTVGKSLSIGENPDFEETHYIPNYTEGDYQVEWLYAPEMKLGTPVTVKIK